MGVVPSGLAGILESQTAQHREKAGFGASAVVDGIDTGTTEVTDCLIGFIRDENRNQFTGTEQTGEFYGVLFVGFDMIADFGGNEGGGYDRAWNFHFEKHPGNPHAATARLVANGNAGKRNVAIFGDAPDQAVESNLGGGYLAVGTDFPIGAGIGNGNRGFFFMDVESDVKCRGRV